MVAGKLSAQVKVKSGGDALYKLYKQAPHDASKMTQNLILSCDLHEGSWGQVGSVISWKYIVDGEQKVVKEIVEEVDDVKKLISFRVIEGHLLEFYKDFKVIFHVETKGDFDLVSWTLEYEKMNEDIEEPYTSLQLLVDSIKHIDNHYNNYKITIHPR